MKKRRLISLMLAGALASGVMVAAAGCSEDDQITEGRAVMNSECKNVYIVLQNGDKKIVHKGDFVPVFYSGTGSFSAGTGFVDLKLDCGKNYTTNADCYIYNNKPEKEEDYNTVCEDCFC